MARKRQDPAHLLRKAMLRRRAGIDGHRPVNHKADDLEGLEDIGARVQRVLDIVRSDKRRPTDMLFFVMYDIESNKVRRAVAKYLLRRGCHRVQKSIFLADISSEQKYDSMATTSICPITNVCGIRTALDQRC